ncbi:MAG: methyltransferase domain-containing protein [Pseudomonadota bacterium]
MASERGRATKAKNGFDRVVDQCRFIGAMARAPKITGAVAPSSRHLAAMMVRTINKESGDPILELGPGTGAITRAIVQKCGAPDRVTCVEYEDRLAQKLATRFPATNVLQGDAFQLNALERLPRDLPFGCVISSLPLLNFDPELRQSLLADAMDLLRPGGAFVQFSYGFSAPIDANQSEIKLTASRWVLRNLPPARVWTYIKPDM